MQYSLFPFQSFPVSRNGLAAGGPDLTGQLQVRRSIDPYRGTGIDNLELLTETIDLLRGLPWQILIDHCEESGGDLRLAVVASGLSRDIDVGDIVQAGFFLQNSESGEHECFAAERIYRVVCSNGALLECDPGQMKTLSTGGGWKAALAAVVERSFSAEGLDIDAARFRATTTQMVMTPFETLCNLVAQGIISEEEQCDIQAEFDDVGDYTRYGLINAVTRIAGRLRDFEDWKRSVELERLGGEILRGLHNPPVLDPVYS